MTIKSVFISLWLMLLSLALFHGLWHLVRDPAALGWWAVLVALLPTLLFFARLFLVPVARTGRVLPIPLLGAVAGTALLVFADSYRLQWCYVLVIGLGGNLLYQFWYSVLARTPSSALQPGQVLPAMQFQDSQGADVTTDNLPGPLLLMFYRGNWCPLCMAQIREVATQYRELERRGVTTLLISAQSPGHTAALAAKFDVPFRFLIDQDLAMAQRFGLLAKGGTPAGMEVLGYDSDTTLPTVILTDADKRIIFADETDNYRIRPEPETFLRALDEAGQGV